MTVREVSGVEKPVIAYAEKQGFLYRKLGWIGRRGAPDRLFSRSDTGPFLVEFKRPGKTPDKLQEREIARLRKAGMTVHVIDNAEAGFALFD
ncbi:MAG: hypothetical protein DI537_20480 [Stutzerimonas stutzeri]|nr:MAG: hypothetical protein DI537_20480 [Stutzerimonas stutzeri]